MSHKKFDEQKYGAYWENYFKRDKEFYQIILRHINKNLSGKKTYGLDIGCGPGVGAKLSAEVSLNTTIIGYEPSDTHSDAIKLSKDLEKANSPTKFIPKKGGINEISGIKERSLDYILILRALHEIAESIRGKDQLKASLIKVIKLLKRDGVLIIGEPQFSPEITLNTKKYSNIIREVQAYQLKTIGHNHFPEDYFMYEELETFLKREGLQLIDKNILENSKVLDYLNQKGFGLNSSPNLFYIETYKK